MGSSLTFSQALGPSTSSKKTNERFASPGSSGRCESEFGGNDINFFMGTMELASTLFLPSSFAGVLPGPGEGNPIKHEVRQHGCFPGAPSASRPLFYLDANTPAKHLLVLSNPRSNGNIK